MCHAAFSRLRVGGPRVALSPEGAPFATPEPRGPPGSMWGRMPPPLPPLSIVGEGIAGNHRWRGPRGIAPSLVPPCGGIRSGAAGAAPVGGRRGPPPRFPRPRCVRPLWGLRPSSLPLVGPPCPPKRAAPRPLCGLVRLLCFAADPQRAHPPHTHSISTRGNERGIFSTTDRHIVILMKKNFLFYIIIYTLYFT